MTLNRGEPVPDEFRVAFSHAEPPAVPRQRRWTFEVTVTAAPDPAVWELAGILCQDRDVHRRAQPDGSVMIENGAGRK